MTKKRFVYYEHKGADYILDTPNTELDFIEMLGDALEPEEIVDKLNDLNDENTELNSKNTNLIITNKELKCTNIELAKKNEQLKQIIADIVGMPYEEYIRY